MILSTRRHPAPRLIQLDRSLEELPLFRLSDSSDEGGINYTTEAGGRWRVLPAPGDRLPGTFDQDVYVELMRRFQEAGQPGSGVTFTLHAFLRAIGRQPDGRTYEQLRAALGRLERTTLESVDAYHSAAAGGVITDRFSILSSVHVERRRREDVEQLQLFPALAVGEPGEARVVLGHRIRENVAARRVAALSPQRYAELPSPVARRLYRLIEAARADGILAWRVSLERLRDQLPLAQHYPSHLQRVLQPANDMLRDAGVIRSATFQQRKRKWFVDYVLGTKHD